MSVNPTNRTETVNGIFELLGKELYARTPYGLFPVLNSAIKTQVTFNELNGKSAEFTVQHGLVKTYHFIDE